MKWEHKIGIGITCTFLCLIGAVIGLKMQEPPPPASPKVAAADRKESAPPMPETKTGISFKDLDNMQPIEPPPAPRPNTSDDLPGRIPPSGNSPKQNPDGSFSLGNTTKENSSFGNNGKPNVKDNVPTQGLGAKDTTNAMQNNKDDLAISGDGKKNNATISTSPPLAVEPNPTVQKVEGDDEWGRFSTGSKEKKQGTTPASPTKDPKSASPSLPPIPEAKEQKPKNQSAPALILPASGTEPVLAPAEQQSKPVAVSPAPPASSPSSPPGTGSPPAQPAAVNPTKSATPAEPAFPSYFSQQPTNAPKAPDLKEKDKTPLSPTPASGKAPEMPAPLAPSAQASTPPVNPTIGPATPISPTPAPASPVAPPSAPMPTPVPAPVIIPGPTSTPAPASPASSQTPPKPPTEGSAFIPDNSSTATGPVGVKPAPLPLPVMPPSSPLAATADKTAAPPLAVAPEMPTPARPASNGASVTVYDEQDYSVRAGDTWEQISKQFYMTDRYAKALQRHNQLHARASERMKDSGQVAQGERIFVPQAYVLEDRYADAILKPAATPTSTMPATFVAPSSSPPPAPPPPPAPLPPGNGTAPPPLNK